MKVELFKRAGTASVYAINLKSVWLVAIATILSKTFKIYFLFMSAIAHNRNLDKLFVLFKQIRPPFPVKKVFVSLKICYSLLYRDFEIGGGAYALL